MVTHPHPERATRLELQKRCSKCKSLVPITGFNKDRATRDGLASECRSCNVKRHRERYKKESQKPGFSRRGDLSNRYRMTTKQYDRMFTEQGGVCAVCKQSETRRRPWSKNGEIQPLAVDHDHKTGEVRSLLCATCNSALGFMGEDPERIRALADYAEWCKKRESPVKIIQQKLLG